MDNRSINNIYSTVYNIVLIWMCVHLFSLLSHITQGMETAAKNAREMAQQEPPSTSENANQNVNQVENMPRRKSKFSGTCFCCGKTGHKQENCRLKDAKCNACGRIGHIKKVCRNKLRKGKPARKKTLHQGGSSEESLDDSSDNEYAYAITSRNFSWLCVLKLDWHAIFWLHNETLQQLIQKYKSVFEPRLGKVTGHTARILIDPGAPPKFRKARPVPYLYHDKVEKELSRLVEEGTLEAVEHSEWASPIVVV